MQLPNVDETERTNKLNNQESAISLSIIFFVFKYNGKVPPSIFSSQERKKITGRFKEFSAIIVLNEQK